MWCKKMTEKGLFMATGGDKKKAWGRSHRGKGLALSSNQFLKPLISGESFSKVSGIKDNPKKRREEGKKRGRKPRLRCPSPSRGSFTPRVRVF